MNSIINCIANIFLPIYLKFLMNQTSLRGGKSTQEEIENLNCSMSSKEIKSMINIFPTKKTPGSDGFPGEILQNISGKVMSILHKFFQRINKKREETFSSSFHKANIMLTKPCRGITIKKITHLSSKIVSEDGSISMLQFLF